MSSWKFPALWKYSARHMKRRPGRTILTMLGIVIGVSTIVAVSGTTQATRRAYRDMFEPVTARGSLEVVSEGYGGFSEGLEARIGSVPGVKAAVPVIQTPAAL